MKFGSCILFFLAVVTFSYGYIPWNPRQLEYGNSRNAVAEAIAQEARRKYNSRMLLNGKPKNSIFPNPWSSNAAFPMLRQKANELRKDTKTNNKLQKLTKNEKTKAKQYSLCYLIFCTSRRNDGYYVPRKSQN